MRIGSLHRAGQLNLALSGFCGLMLLGVLLFRRDQIGQTGGWDVPVAGIIVLYALATPALCSWVVMQRSRMAVSDLRLAAALGVVWLLVLATAGLAFLG